MLENLASGQQVGIFTAMARVGGDALPGAMTMFAIVPAFQALHPGAGRRQVREGRLGKAGAAVKKSGAQPVLVAVPEASLLSVVAGREDAPLSRTG